jgi:hypothetical protein
MTDNISTPDWKYRTSNCDRPELARRRCHIISYKVDVLANRLSDIDNLNSTVKIMKVQYSIIDRNSTRTIRYAVK